MAKLLYLFMMLCFAFGNSDKGDLKFYQEKVGGRAHSPPGVKWLLEPMDINNVNAPPTLRYKFQDLIIVT